MTDAAHIPQVGAKVRHPLYPELGIGEVKTVNAATTPTHRSGRIHWSCGQVSSHNLAILREVGDLG